MRVPERLRSGTLIATRRQTVPRRSSTGETGFNNSVPRRETANTVRYWRKASRNGQFEADFDVRVATGIRLANMLAGGYNADARRVLLKSPRW
jgi:hypothetical protein